MQSQRPALVPSPKNFQLIPQFGQLAKIERRFSSTKENTVSPQTRLQTQDRLTLAYLPNQPLPQDLPNIPVSHVQIQPKTVQQMEGIMDTRLEQLETELRQLREVCKELAKSQRSNSPELTFDTSSPTSNQFNKLKQQLIIKERIIQQLASGNWNNQEQQSDSIRQKYECLIQDLQKDIHDKSLIIRSLQERVFQLENGSESRVREQYKDQEIEDLHRVIAELQESQADDMSRKDNEIEQLRQVLKEIQRETQILQDQLRRQNSSMKNRPNELQIKENEINQLLRQMQKNDNDYKSQVLEYQNEIQSLQLLCGELENKLNSKHERSMFVADVEMDILNQQIKDRDQQIFKYKNQIIELKNQLFELHGQIKALQEKYTSAEIQYKQQEELLEIQKDNVKDLETQIGILKDEAIFSQQKHDSQLVSYADQLRERTNQIYTLEASLENLQTSLATQKTESEIVILNLQERIDIITYEREKQMHEKEREMIELKKQNEILSLKIQDLQKMLSDVQRESQDLNRQIMCLRHDNSIIIDTNILKKQEMIDKQNLIENIQRQQEALKHQRKKSVDLQRTADDLQQKNQESNQILEFVMQFLGISDPKIIHSQLQTEYQRFNKQNSIIEQIQEELMLLKRQNSELQDQVCLYEHELEYLESYKMKYAEMCALGEDKVQLLMLLTFAFAEIEALRSRQNQNSPMMVNFKPLHESSLIQKRIKEERKSEAPRFSQLDFYSERKVRMSHCDTEQSITGPSINAIPSPVSSKPAEYLQD